ncbi:MAG: protein kinase [Magnetococcales bacterium]|nr:protein kinase [Magnetococcales bacterium]
MKKSYPDAYGPGTLLNNQYEVKKVLGQGGFGITYLGHDEALEMSVAIKEYFPTTFAIRNEEGQVVPKNDEVAGQFQWGLDRFIQEARTLAKFKHPNLVRVLTFFKHNNTAFMVMEYEEGESLFQVIKRRKVLEEGEVRGILFPLLSGLKTLHHAGIIHRDIKPDNIFIRRKDGSPVLLDFGSARQAMGDGDQSLTALLTPGYAPFEQYFSSNEKQGPWTDIYAMAAVLYRIIAGKVPHYSTDRSSALLSEMPDPTPLLKSLGHARSHYSEALLDGIDWGMKVLVKDRPQRIESWEKVLDRRSEAEAAFEEKANRRNKEGRHVLKEDADVETVISPMDDERLPTQEVDAIADPDVKPATKDISARTTRGRASDPLDVPAGQKGSGEATRRPTQSKTAAPSPTRTPVSAPPARPKVVPQLSPRQQKRSSQDDRENEYTRISGFTRREAQKYQERHSGKEDQKGHQWEIGEMIRLAVFLVFAVASSALGLYFLFLMLSSPNMLLFFLTGSIFYVAGWCYWNFWKRYKHPDEY